jgi:hypothetical protein
MQWADAARRANEELDLAQGCINVNRRIEALGPLSQATAYYLIVRRAALNTRGFRSNTVLQSAYNIRKRLRTIEKLLTPI